MTNPNQKTEGTPEEILAEISDAGLDAVHDYFDGRLFGHVPDDGLSLDTCRRAVRMITAERDSRRPSSA